MQIDASKNPQAVLDAVTNPSPLTISQISLLEKTKSPLLVKEFGSIEECVKATYLVNIPFREAVIKAKDSDELVALAMEWADGIGWEEYEKKLAELVVGLVKFWKMLPPEETEKKTTETGLRGKSVTDS